MNTARIAESMLELDPDNDDHWTLEGLPLVDVVASLAGTKLKRQELTNIAPDFNRNRARELRDDRIAAAHAPKRKPSDADGTADIEAELELELEDDGGIELDVDQPEPISALKMDPREVMKSRSLTERALRELEVLSKDANDRKKAAEDDLDKLNFKIQIMSTQLDRMSRTAVDPHSANINAYHQRTQESRHKRVEAAQRFIAAGTTPKDVLEQLSSTSPIDRAMARKTGRGTQRPNVPLMPTGMGG